MAGMVLTADAEARVAADLHMDSEDVQRLQDDIKSAQEEEPACTMPDIRITTQDIDGTQREVASWHETNGNDNVGTTQIWQLTPSQYESYKLLKTGPVTNSFSPSFPGRGGGANPCSFDS
eukprot:scaffold6883_cov91-Phaeocystis_antarctica.AAC.4